MSEQTNPIPSFDSVRQLNAEEAEYWSARELMPLLGYQNWREFEGAIKRAMMACEQTGNIITDHFVPNYKMVTLGSGARRKVKDYILSRFACYLIAENGNSRIPQIAAAQVYFAVATREKELKQLEAARNVQERLALHAELTANYEALAKAVERAGVMPKDFGKFQEAGYKGMYGGLGLKEIKERKGVGQEEDLPDRMGRAELAANSFLATLTEQNLYKNNVQESELAVEVHQEIGHGVRETIKKLGGTVPEDLAAEPSIKPLLKKSKGAAHSKLANDSEKGQENES